jgi:aminoglycoside phosphotransferase (APT) family kinase protein
VALEDGTERVLRVSPWAAREQVAAQVWTMAACAARGVPVPRVLAYDTEGRTFPEPYLLMERLHGVVLPRAGLDGRATRAVTVELGRQLSAIHTIAVAGFGPLKRTADGYRGRHGTLWDAIAAELDKWVMALGREVLPSALADKIRECLDRARTRGLFDSDGAVLVHRGFQFRNVLVAGGRLTGVLDFDKAEAGDPVRDFAVLYPGDVALLRQGYEEAEPGALGERFDERLDAYRILGSLERLWHDEAGGRAGQREQTHGAIHQLVAALSSGRAG